MKYCSKKHGNPDDAEFCHECGEKLQERKREGGWVCPRCGSTSLINDFFCARCGYIISTGGTMPGYKMPFIKIKHCLKCGIANPNDAEFCFKCGCKLGEPLSFPPVMEKRLKYLQDRKKKCRECGELNLTFAAFCIKCGHKFEEQSEGENKTESSLSSKISNSGEKVCQKCKAVNPKDAEFCAECGASLTQQSKPKPQPTPKPQHKLNNGEKVCQKCKAVNPNDAEFCAECGASLTQQSKPKPQPTPKPQPKLKNGEKVCQKCKAVNPKDADFCAECGASLTPQPTPHPDPNPQPQPKSDSDWWWNVIGLAIVLFIIWMIWNCIIHPFWVLLKWLF